jgi:hypothetical protein
MIDVFCWQDPEVFVAAAVPSGMGAVLDRTPPSIGGSRPDPGGQIVTRSRKHFSQDLNESSQGGGNVPMAWIVQKHSFGLEKQDRNRTGSRNRNRATLILAWT